MAGYGIRAFLIAQSLNQIEKAYGEHNAILDNCHVRVAFATNDERTAKRISDALGTATEQRAMRNYAGHRLAPWLAHVMVSRQETARALLTPGEVMQLPPSDELLLVSGHSPVRAKKLRYFDDRTFTARVLPAPVLAERIYADRPPLRTNNWGRLARLPDARLVATDSDTRDDDAAEGGVQQERHPGLPQEQAVTRDEPATADLLGLGEEDSDAAADARMMDQSRAATVARAAYGIDAGVSPAADLVPGF